ncbi:hypothetical protein M3592_28025 [Priestia aryabhattai]|uniref:hypothetical protein n=1 Tax=Priestia aryabhattai TaxID=412384 RepID=UPI00203C8B16|nr:hypothetical protein [Priestia aryabhattai]MCM2979230.1 hypothetical protein [Priestia aryabhattai]
MSTTFYHGTIEPNGEKIYDTQSFLFSDGEKHLLGKGIYLYKDPIQAKVWARMKADYEKSKPVILEVEVDVNQDDYLDLDIREHQDFFFRQRKQFLTKIKEKSLTHVQAHYTDSHFCDFLVGRTNDTIVAKTFVYALPHESRAIPVRYTNQKQTDRNITRHYRTEKQYCIKNHTLIKNIGILDL